MLKNFFIVTLRNLWRHKFFSFINLIGLAVGISTSLVLSMIVFYEFSYDQFEPNKDQTYRIVMKTNANGFEGYSGAVPSPLGKAVSNEIPGIEQSVPIFSFPRDSKVDVRVNNPKGDKDILFKKQENVILTNQHYTELLNYQWLAGNPSSALEQPFQVVLTHSRASMYFPHKKLAEIIGSRITYNDIDVTVTGIVRDINQATDFRGKEFISLKTLETGHLKEEMMMDNWNDWMGYSKLFITLSLHTNPEQVAKELNQLYNKHKQKESFFSEISLILVPLTDMHFDFRCQSHDARIVHKSTLYGLTAIAAFLLLLGCINYINLTTAQTSKRAKEVGIRKTVGSSKKQLVFQFLGETFLITTLAMFLSVLLIPFLIQIFSSFVPEGLHISFLLQPKILLFLLVLNLLLTVFAGLYPAFILSAYKPSQVIKNEALTTFGQTRQGMIRKMLTVFQFVIAQFFIISTLMISKQIYFVLHTDMGFQKEAVFTINIPRDSISRHRTHLLQRFQNTPGVAMVSSGFVAPAMEGGAFANLTYHNGKQEIKPHTQVRWGDENYFKVYDIQLIAGRTVTPSDSITELVVNKNFTKEIGFRQAADALGKFITYDGKQVPIVGIMKDFHTQTFRAEISSVVFGNRPGDTFHIKLRPQNPNDHTWQKTIATIGNIFKETYPEEDFNYEFVDERIAKFYLEEQRTATLLRWATGLAIFISCLGLLGLVTYTTNSRTKEVGIRKVLGATISQIITLLSKDFIRLVLIAFIIAAPIAWWVTHEWLKAFAYKTNISWWVFLISGTGMLIIAIFVLGIQTMKTANANPTKSLRDE